MKDLLTIIYSSHYYFRDKVKINPNKLFLHPRESCDVKDFCWALTVEE